MKKKVISLFCELFVAIALAILGMYMRTEYYSTLVFAMGCGLGGGALTQLIRIAYYNRPAHRAEYEKKNQEAHIASVDERQQLIRAKACQKTYQVMVIAIIMLDFVLALLHVEAWVILLVLLLLVMQIICYVISYHTLQKRL